MKQVCNFCPNKDIVQVVPGLAVDVNSTIESGIIEDKSAKVFHNMMSDIAEIGKVARDQFDIIEYERAYTKFRKFVNDSEKNKDKDK